VGISYAQYSRYESGEQFPGLEQALMLCKVLGVPAAEALVEWALAQVSDATLRGEIESLARQASQGTAPALPVPLDDVIVFNRSHLELFRSDPAYRDLFTYVNSFAPEWISEDELAGALELDRAKLGVMIDRLHQLGVITLERGASTRCRATKRNFYFPDDEEFFELRNSNLSRNAGQILKTLKSDDLRERRAYRGLLTRELTAPQLDLVVSRLDQLLGGVIALPETSRPERVYSLCLLMGERFARTTLNT
jgi:transcriptional regulator with XRE-family HTH domain